MWPSDFVHKTCLTSVTRWDSGNRDNFSPHAELRQIIYKAFCATS